MMHLMDQVGDEIQQNIPFLVIVPGAEVIAECAQNGARIPKFERHWEFVRWKHAEFLTKKTPSSTVEGETVPLLHLMPIGMPGARTRLAKLVGPKLFEMVWSQHQKALDVPEDGNYPNNDFSIK